MDKTRGCGLRAVLVLLRCRGRCCPPLLLLLGVALGLFYQTRTRTRPGPGTDPEEAGLGLFYQTRTRTRPGPGTDPEEAGLGLFYQTRTRTRPGPGTDPEEAALEDTLRFGNALDKLQAQNQAVWAGPGLRGTALVLTGQHLLSDTEVQLYQRVLQQTGFQVRVSRYAESSSLLRPKQGMRDLSLLLCLSSSETSCLRRVSFSELQDHQRVNLLPQMMKAFSDAGDGLCHLFTQKTVAGSKLSMRPNSCASGHQKLEFTTANDLTKPTAASPAPGVVLNVYVLVSSVDPLTSFLHDTIVLMSSGKNRGRTTRLKTLTTEELGYAASYETMIGHIKRVIGDVLQAVASSYQKDQIIKRCLMCYQLLTFTLLFNAPLTLSIIQVDTDWTFSGLNDETFEQDIAKDLMLEDMLHFLLKSPLSSVTKAECTEDNGCAQTLGVPLSQENLQLLLHFYQQIKSPGPFQPVFSSPNLCFSSARPRSVSELLIKAACSFELQKNHSLKTTEAESLDCLNQENGVCSDPVLRQIYTDPALSLAPPFDPRVREYRAEVPFDLVTVRIRPEPLTSSCRVHLDEIHGPRTASLPLGLGHSRIRVFVSDGESDLVLSVYTLHVVRESRPSLPMFGDHVTCSFTQECGLWVQPDQACGLEPFNQTLSPEPCAAGDAPGRWVVPCLSCLDNRTCDWRDIVWQPDHCSHPEIDRPQLQGCLAETKLLFIGDSTNRGMMYFLMERVNSSLQDWEKAHDTLIYRNLNQGRTLVSYSYYPQFWLESSHRPTFTESLDTLLDRSQPLSNSRRTVLVVGGVQWLNTNHLRVIRDTLHRKGLSNILVVVKSLGMGFHLLVDGVRSLRLREIQELFRDNQNLLSAAKKYNFEVVDTFSITMGRHKEFLQGRCACHFHEVQRHVSSSSNKSSKSRATKPGSEDTVDHGTGTNGLSYKVLGQVNQVYSEILLSRLCLAKEEH